MRKTTALAAALAAAALQCAAAGAAAEDDLEDRVWYVGLDALAGLGYLGDARTRGLAGTVTSLEDDDLVLGGRGQLGRVLGRLRAEVEVTWRYRFDYNTTIVSGPVTTRLKNDVETRSVMANLAFDLARWGPVTPYVLGGLGYVENRSEAERGRSGTLATTGRDHTESGLGWSLGAGALWSLGRGWHLKVAYRFSDLGEVASGRFADGLEQSADAYRSHDFALGVQYRF